MLKNGLLVIIATAGIFIAGCEKWSDEYLKTSKYRFLSPEKVVERPEDAQVSFIINALGDIDKEEQLFPNARRPSQQDWLYEDTDYVLTSGDIIDIAVMDLYAQGAQEMLRKEISQSGYIDLPLLAERIKAEGLTALELDKAIEDAYKKTVLKDPQISVTILSRRKQTFSILGAVGAPGTYQITKKDMRILDVLALCGGIYQRDIEYIYIIRQAKAIRKSEHEKSKAAEKIKAAPKKPAKGVQLKELDELMNGKVNSAAIRDEVTMAEVAGEQKTVDGGKNADAGNAEAKATKAGDSYRWQFVNNRWVKVPVGQKADTAAKSADTDPRKLDTSSQEDVAKTKNEKSKDPFDWADLEKADLVEVIAINRRKLEQGDFRQNIVIHNDDIIRVPLIEVGEFYLMGEVARPGVYALSSKGITVKMAVAAAGNLGPMAWPENSIIIRRVGKNQEQMIPVNVEKIFKGEDPDVYLKPNDILAVGTHWSSTFIAVIRNAFRMSYGFGFIYDRNFGDPYSPSLNSNRFSRW